MFKSCDQSWRAAARTLLHWAGVRSSASVGQTFMIRKSVEGNAYNLYLAFACDLDVLCHAAGLRR
jgi:hypothetical protein